jgi:hypothetical protein
MGARACFGCVAATMQAGKPNLDVKQVLLQNSDALVVNEGQLVVSLVQLNRCEP